LLSFLLALVVDNEVIYDFLQKTDLYQVNIKKIKNLWVFNLNIAQS